MSSFFKNHICKGDNCMYCLSHVQQAYQVARLFRSSAQNFSNNSNNNQCCYDSPTKVPQRVTVEATSIMINPTSLEAISHCQIIQSNLQPIEQQVIPSPTILVKISSDSEDESESILMEPTVAENESEICKTEYFEQEPMLESIRDQASFCNPSIETTFKEIDETVDNRYCLLEVASQFPPSTSSTEMCLSASDGQESISNAHKTCENQSSLQNATAPINDPLFLDNMSIPGAEKSKRGPRPKCKCPNCRAKGANKIRASNGKPLHICHIPNCGNVYRISSHLNRHLDTHSGEKNYFCAHCNTGFTRKDNLGTHVKKCQYLNYPAKIGREKRMFNGKLLEPQVLEKVVTHTKSLQRHLVGGECLSVNCSVKDGKKTTCLNSKAHLCPIPDCGKRFRFPSEFRLHLDQHYGKKNFFCEHCNKGFTLKSNLKQHLKIHLSPERTAKLPSNSVVPRHKRTHASSQTAYGKSFVSKSGLAKHVQSHKKVCECPCLNCSVQHGKNACNHSQHVCHILGCGRVYSNIYNFKRHLDLHSGKKSFFCTHCNKGFARKDKLQSHIQVHMQREAKHTKC